MRPLGLLILALVLAAPAQAEVGPDHVAGDGVALLQNVRLTGAGQGGGAHGDRLVVTGPSHLTAFDITDPAAPRLLGVAPVGAANESEDVPGDGRWAAVSEAECADAAVRGPCLGIFDVTGAPQRIASLGMAAQTAACVLACRYLWVTGANAIVDMADPAAPRVVGSFLADEDRLQKGCYSSREARPGVVVVACDPIFVLSTLPEHGGTVTAPAVLAFADSGDYTSTAPLGGVPHGGRWPGGDDAFLLASTETPFSPRCGDDNLGAFVVWDARPVLAGARSFRRLSEWRPANGGYLDGRSPYNAVGCSPHFIAEHPSFDDGGLVAVAALENGLRLLQVTPQGTLEERSYFLGLGGTAATPVWHPGGRIIYLVDYARGLDVLAYDGPTYVPARPPAQAPAPVPATAVAPRRFRVLGVIRNQRGRATIAVEAPARGRVTVTARARRGPRLRTARATVRHAGLVTVTIAATGRARRLLARRGRLAVDARVAWRPRSGSPRAKRLRIVLRR